MANKYQDPSYSQSTRNSEEAWREASVGQRGFFQLDSANPYYTVAVNSLSVQSVANVSGNVWRYTFESSADLSKLSKGHFLIIDGTVSAENTGIFRIVDFNNTTHTVDIINAHGVAQAVAGGNGKVDPYKNTMAIVVDDTTTFTSLIIKNQFGADISTSTLYAGTIIYGNVLEAVVSTGSAKIYYF